ncbi:MAG: hypothetical protein IT373_35970 [Polyangiaceae bacterium]|nr:hypothetical protein [Polyangiaceae bacterium]
MDLLLSRVVSHRELTAILSSVLGVSSATITCVDGHEDLPAVATPVACVVYMRGGEFPEQVTLILPPELEPVDLDAEILLAKSVAGLLGADVLAVDDSANPYVMLHVSRSGATAIASLDAEALDERGEYRIVRK